MKTALIGHTGFVGSNLATQNSFSDCYNTKNIDQIDGKSYDLVISAGARAEKWRINQEPEKDRAEIEDLIRHIETVKAKKLILISTVDVYKHPIAVDEDTSIDTKGLQAYGLNRYYLEQYCKDKFDTLIVRLPALFGRGLKKNVIYDLLHNNNVDRIHHDGSFQYYNLNNIWADIQTALSNNLQLVNFATEPVTTAEIAKKCFGLSNFDNEPEDVVAGSYDMHTRYAKIFNGQGFYIYNKQQVLEDIEDFVASQRKDLSL